MIVHMFIHVHAITVIRTHDDEIEKEANIYMALLGMCSMQSTVCVMLFKETLLSRKKCNCLKEEEKKVPRGE